MRLDVFSEHCFEGSSLHQIADRLELTSGRSTTTSARSTSSWKRSRAGVIGIDEIPGRLFRRAGHSGPARKFQ